MFHPLDGIEHRMVVEPDDSNGGETRHIRHQLRKGLEERDTQFGIGHGPEAGHLHAQHKERNSKAEYSVREGLKPRFVHKAPMSYTPIASITSRATAAPEYCCCPVIRFPSRTAWALKRLNTMKFVFSSFLASSSIQNGWIRLPTNSSANFSSELANPVHVFPSTRSFPSTAALSRMHVAWQRTAVIFPAA